MEKNKVSSNLGTCTLYKKLKKSKEAVVLTISTPDQSSWYTLRYPTDLYKHMEVFDAIYNSLPVKFKIKIDKLFSDCKPPMIMQDDANPLTLGTNNFSIVHTESYFRLLKAMGTRDWNILIDACDWIRQHDTSNFNYI